MDATYFEKWLCEQPEYGEIPKPMSGIALGLAEKAWSVAQGAERERCAKFLETVAEAAGACATERTMAGEAASDYTGHLRFAQSDVAMGLHKTLNWLAEEIRTGQH